MEKEMGKKWKVGKTAADIRDGVKIRWRTGKEENTERIKRE